MLHPLYSHPSSLLFYFPPLHLPPSILPMHPSSLLFYFPPLHLPPSILPMHSTGPCRHKPRLRLNISQSISFVTWRRGPMSLAYHTHQLWNKLSEEGCHLFTLQVPVNGMLHHVTQKTTKLWNRKKNGMLQSGNYNLLINTVATGLQLYTSGSRDMSSCKRGLGLTQTQRWWGLHGH